MGKTKIATIDDSVIEEKDSKVKSQKKQKGAKKDVVQISETQSESGEVKNSGGVEDSQNDKENEIATSQAPGNDEKKEATSTKSSSEPKKDAKKEVSEKKIRSKKYQEAIEKVDRGKNYTLNEAVEKVKGVSYSKFDGTIEIHLNTAQKNLRGLVTLPFSAGKKLTVLAFGEGAEQSGADKVGNEETVEEILKGKTDFDIVITTPAWMPKLAKAARILGPRGIMPNPKNGTITDNLKKAVTEVQSGKTEYKNEKSANVMHLGIGKVSQASDEVAQNVKILITTIGKTRIKKATLAPTMGPGVKVDLSSI